MNGGFSRRYGEKLRVLNPQSLYFSLTGDGRFGEKLRV